MLYLKVLFIAIVMGYRRAPVLKRCASCGADCTGLRLCVCGRNEWNWSRDVNHH